MTFFAANIVDADSVARPRWTKNVQKTSELKTIFHRHKRLLILFMTSQPTQPWDNHHADIHIKSHKHIHGHNETF